MTAIEAHLFVSWKTSTCNYMKDIKNLLQMLKDYLNFRGCFRTIMDWAKGKRYEEWRAALDVLVKYRKTSAPGMEVELGSSGQ